MMAALPKQSAMPLSVRGAAAWFVLFSCSSCGDEGPRGEGKVRIELKAEATITDGLAQGTEAEDSRDYAVRFTKYLATFGNVRLANTSDDQVELAEQFVADMVQVGEAGVELGVLSDVQAGQWAYFGFDTPVCRQGAMDVDCVRDADVSMMIEVGLTYWIEGVVERAEAEGGPVSFVIQTAVPTVYRDCEHDEEPGVSVVADGTSTATITLHGDHIFFNRFPTGAESDVVRLAGWVIAADTDGDGKVRTEDLSMLDATEVFTSELGYSLGGTDYTIDNALDYVRAQLSTQGHYAGEGHCSSELLEGSGS